MTETKKTTGEKTLKAETMSGSKNAAEAGKTLSVSEQRAHREHLRRLKKLNKKKKKQITVLVLECLLLCVIIGAYIGVDYVADKLHRIKRIDLSDVTSTEAAGGPSRSGLPTLGPGKETQNTQPTIVVTDAAGSTEYIEVKITDPAPTESRTLPSPIEPDEKSGFYTFCAFGVDARDVYHLEKESQGDVVILISVNKATYEVRMASVYRDLYFECTNGEFCKLTDCYARYGNVETTKALNRNFDLQIDDIVCVNWTAVADVVDAMGGLDVEMTEMEANEVNWYIWETQVATGRDTIYGVELMDGVQHLNGVQVVCFARIRHNVGDDYARTARQRYVIDLMLKKAKTMSLSSINKIINMAVDEVAISFDDLEIFSLAKDVLRYNITETTGFPFPDKIKAADYIYANNLVDNVEELHRFLYSDDDYVASDNVRRISAYHEAEINYYFY